jgi:hypothetical protein
MNISHNYELKTLKGCPRTVGGFFNAVECNLESLIGGPEFVGGDYNVSHNDLTTLDGFPKEIEGWVMIGDNSVEFTEEEIRSVSNVKGKVFTSISHLFDK